jgi:hypothetical protein
LEWKNAESGWSGGGWHSHRHGDSAHNAHISMARHWMISNAPDTAYNQQAGFGEFFSHIPDFK